MRIKRLFEMKSVSAVFSLRTISSALPIHVHVLNLDDILSIGTQDTQYIQPEEKKAIAILSLVNRKSCQ